MPAENTGKYGTYVLVEKIIASYEHLSKQWPVAGTTGYRFANVVNGLFVDAASESRIDRVYSSFIGKRIDYAALVYRCKKLIMRVSLANQLNVLANELSRIALSDRHTCDFTVNSLRDALVEVTACFPVYRTYVTADQVSEDDKRFIDWAVSAARKKSRAADVSVFDFIRGVLLTHIAEGRNEFYRSAVVRFAMRFQQFSSPVMAKAMEDTSFYIYNRLTSLNEVGGDPGTFGISLTAFHGASQDRAKNWPHTMLATSTHDGKRSEDVRARINVLSELPALWRLKLYRWSRLNRSKKISLDNEQAPSRNDEYLLYQTLIGAWPVEPMDDPGFAAFSQRIEQYMLKALREAKVHTSWLNPNIEYENALVEFVRNLLTPGKKNLFIADFLPFQQTLSRIGMFNSLSQTLIKLTSPGVPDIYQGNELWDFSLVDPDNTRRVDYRQRRSMLEELKYLSAVEGLTLTNRVSALLQSMEDGRIKLYMHWRILQLRRELVALFCGGDYLPLYAEGNRADHVCAFARVAGGQATITVAPRLFYGLVGDRGQLPLGSEVWQDTRIEIPDSLPQGQWKNVLTGEMVSMSIHGDKRHISIAELLKNLPYALLMLTMERH